MRSQLSLFSLNGTTFKSSNIPGMARIVQNTKKFCQPKDSTIKPVVAFQKVHGTADKEVKSANWVAVQALFVVEAIKDTKAAVPKPAPKNSATITNTKSRKLGVFPVEFYTQANSTKPKMVIS